MLLLKGLRESQLLEGDQNRACAILCHPLQRQGKRSLR